MEYAEFLEGKAPQAPTFGREPDPMPAILYPFQADLVSWAVRRGRAAIFADCGLGKTLMQLEWARQSGERVLIVAPLSVAEQTIAEARKLAMDVVKVERPSLDVPFQIVNYQKLQHFVGADYDAIVLDESSILKSLDGKTRTMLLRDFTHIPRRLCCTATPAPNDIAELANHSEFLGVMPRQEMLASFFVHDMAGRAQAWRLKGHAQDAFWKWMSKWAIYLRRPSDLGYGDADFALPPLTIERAIAESEWKPDGMLFGAGLGGITDRRKVRSGTIPERAAHAVSILTQNADQWLVWCGLNAEAHTLKQLLGDQAHNIEGANSDEEKIAKEEDWRAGRVRVLVTKPSIFGFGMNWQHCHRMMFLGLGDSYEQYYQAIRRCWRFGQSSPVDVRIVVTAAEGEIVDNVKRKELQAARVAEGIVTHARNAMAEAIRGSESDRTPHIVRDASGEGWKLLLGDAVERVREVESGTVGLSVFSPPFATLYTYSASERDLGNSKSHEEFFEHFRFLIPEILRITIPGRRCCVHVQQVTTTMVSHGVTGWRDFRADMVRNFVDCGWVYDGEVVIDKDPQAQAIRTKSKALMFIQKERDASWLRPAMADYILCFRHPDPNPTPVHVDVTNEEWISWARPIWYGIRETETLQFMSARSDKDERHICPLQLETIERCVRLWTNGGEIVFSPFAGIGSEGFVALRKGRRFVGIELKEEYWNQARENLSKATQQLSLFKPEESGHA